MGFDPDSLDHDWFADWISNLDENGVFIEPEDRAPSNDFDPEEFAEYARPLRMSITINNESDGTSNMIVSTTNSDDADPIPTATRRTLSQHLNIHEEMLEMRVEQVEDGTLHSRIFIKGNPSPFTVRIKRSG